MAGLLDFLNTDEGRLGLGLLAAGGPSATPMGIGQRIQSAFQGQDAYKTDALKRQDLAQQIQLRNIQLQQQQQEWAAIQPALSAYAARQSGAQTPSAPSQPAIQPSAGGALGSGTFGMSVGGQPASAPAQQGSPRDPFGIDNIMQGRVISMLGGAPAGSAFFDSLKLPDAVKTNNYYGLDPAAVKASMERETAAKGNMLVRQASTLGRTNPDGTFTPIFTAPDTKDNANITWVNGMPQAAQIPGLLPGIQGVAKATEAGKGEVIPYAGVDGKGNPLPVTNRTAAATQGQLGAPIQVNDPNIPPSTPYQRAGSDVAAIQREIDGVNRSMAPASTKKMQLDILNQELTKAQAAAQAPVAAVPAPSQVYAAPPLGAVKSTDAAQTASARTMQASYAKLQGSNATAQNALDVIDKMQAIAAKKNALFTAGVLGTNQSAINPDAAEYEKQRANLITQLSAQNGTNGTDAGRALTGEAVPDFGKPKSAIADGLGTLRNQTVMQQLKTNLLTPVYQAGDSKKYTTLENEFDQHISPSMVPLLTMPAGKARADALKAAAQNPTLRARLNWAAENGLLK